VSARVSLWLVCALVLLWGIAGIVLTLSGVD
jgi:hypothetical protein